ncbi:MAG: GntR family transcriptional regulator [Peptostreptococcaceae bacterium]|nr:GntR family transcriptional regulator [Peptostreptococcaceae bacterium]MDY5738863.1 GntR family transcriptional regulator [Anaerovoracaceae bacterium]SFE47111.1 DNA-binding transcriptional regulator, GntR family [Peptostreptococcaceae bacterium pGA-8]
MIEYKSVSLANQVFEALENAILRGEFDYGEVVSEKKLAERLGVSRTPVREAMTRLSHEKLIKDIPNGSIIIGIQPKDLRDLMVIKRKIEPLIGASLLENLDEEGLKLLKDIVEQQEFYSRKGDYEKVMRLDTEFHDVLYQISGSVVFETVLSQIHHKLLKYRLASLKDEKRIIESTGEHKLIVTALEEGDTLKVEELLFLHVDHAYNSIMRGALNGTDNSREDN